MPSSIRTWRWPGVPALDVKVTPGVSIMFGLHEMPWLAFEESVNRYRVIGPFFSERLGLIPGPTDLGVSVKASRQRARSTSACTTAKARGARKSTSSRRRRRDRAALAFAGVQADVDLGARWRARLDAHAEMGPGAGNQPEAFRKEQTRGNNSSNASRCIRCRPNMIETQGVALDVERGVLQAQRQVLIELGIGGLAHVRRERKERRFESCAWILT